MLRWKHILKERFQQSVRRRWMQIHARLEGIELHPLSPLASRPFLILAPHADDESIGCGALLIHYPSRCHVICLTDGRAGLKGKSSRQAMVTRRQEFEATMHQAGVARSFYGERIADGRLAGAEREFSALLDRVPLEEYGWIFLPSPIDQHRDHRAVAPLLRRELSRRPAHSDLQICYYEVWSALALPNRYLDLTDTLTEKLRLVSHYRSQVQALDYLGAVSGLARFRGLKCGCRAAEVYESLPVRRFLAEG